jgi:hypothetical protein
VAAGSIAVAVNQEDDDAPIGEGPVREPVASIASAAGLDVEAQLVDHTWGLEIELQGTGFQEGARYRVVVLDRSGQTYPSGEFVGVGDVEMDCALSSAVLRADAVAFRSSAAEAGRWCAATSTPEPSRMSSRLGWELAGARHRRGDERALTCHPRSLHACSAESSSSVEAGPGRRPGPR